jgi:hypothetical protein
VAVSSKKPAKKPQTAAKKVAKVEDGPMRLSYAFIDVNLYVK